MGRMKPAWYYQKQAQEAQARANYYLNRQPPADATVTPRGASSNAYYRSLNLALGTEPLIIKVSVLQSTLNLVSAADAGLKTTLASTESAIGRRLIRLSPSRIYWYEGDATPGVERTAYGTKYIRYYKKVENSHRSIPVSKASGAVISDDIQDRFNSLFGPGGSKLSLLGTANGRAWLEMEKVSVTADS